MRAKTGPCRPFVFVMCRMYQCHLNAAVDNGGLQEMDEMRRWNRNQSHSPLRMMEEVTTYKAQREKDLDVCVTWQHDGKLVYMKRNWSSLGFPIPCDPLTLQKRKQKKLHNGPLLSRNSYYMPCFEIRRSSIDPSSSLFVSCLLLIGIRVTWAHAGDCLITHSSPSIIQLMQSFMWPFQSIASTELLLNSGSCDLGLNIHLMALLFCLFYYVEFSRHLLSVCWLNGFNGPFISLYVANALCVKEGTFMKFLMICSNNNRRRSYSEVTFSQ